MSNLRIAVRGKPQFQIHSNHFAVVVMEGFNFDDMEDGLIKQSDDVAVTRQGDSASGRLSCVMCDKKQYQKFRFAALTKKRG